MSLNCKYMLHCAKTSPTRPIKSAFQPQLYMYIYKKHFTPKQINQYIYFSLAAIGRILLSDVHMDNSHHPHKLFIIVHN